MVFLFLFLFSDRQVQSMQLKMETDEQTIQKVLQFLHLWATSMVEH